MRLMLTLMMARARALKNTDLAYLVSARINSILEQLEGCKQPTTAGVYAPWRDLRCEERTTLAGDVEDVRSKLGLGFWPTVHLWLEQT